MSYFAVQGAAREQWLLDHIGDAPAWCRPSIPLQAGVITLHVAPDYWGIVEADGNFLRTPMLPGTAQKLCDQLDCILPTAKIIDLLRDAGIRLHAYPQPPPRVSEKAYRTINEKNNAETQGVRNALWVGHRKDIVLSNKITSTRMAIYGWHGASGPNPIQPLSAAHDRQYVDYSHGVRMISAICTVNGESMRVADVLRDSVLAKRISGEGVLKSVRY